MNAVPAEIKLRPCRPEDCAAVAQLCRKTVGTVCRRDYAPAELDAWAAGFTPEALASSLAARDAWTAWLGGELAGFADRDGSYLDRLYVRWDLQGRGVATALCDFLEARIDAPAVTVHASRTALPFFLHRGYRLVGPNLVVRRGVTLQNFLLEKPLHAAAVP